MSSSYTYTYGLPEKAFKVQLKLSMAIDKLRPERLVGKQSGEWEWKVMVNPENRERIEQLKRRRQKILDKFQ